MSLTHSEDKQKRTKPESNARKTNSTAGTNIWHEFIWTEKKYRTIVLSWCMLCAPDTASNVTAVERRHGSLEPERTNQDMDEIHKLDRSKSTYGSGRRKNKTQCIRGMWHAGIHTYSSEVWPESIWPWLPRIGPLRDVFGIVFLVNPTVCGTYEWKPVTLPNDKARSSWAGRIWVVGGVDF